MVALLWSLWLQQMHPCKSDVRWQEEGVPSKVGVDHPIDQDFLDWRRTNEKAPEEGERAVQRTEPQGNGQDCSDN